MCIESGPEVADVMCVQSYSPDHISHLWAWLTSAASAWAGLTSATSDVRSVLEEGLI